METKRLALGVGVVVLAAGIGGFLYISRPLPPVTPPVEVTTAPESTEPTSQPEQTTGTVYTIDTTQSTATYEIDELLNGKPKHVVGTATQISGEITLNPTNPSASKLSPITINARTFTSDSERRDNTVGRVILKSAEAAHELIVFTPTTITQLPEKITLGEQFTAEITGDLTIAGVTKPVTFKAKATQTTTN